MCCVEVSWRNKGAKACREDGRARVAMNAKQERIKKVYPLLMGNDNRFFFLDFFLYLSMYQSRHEHRETENGQKLSLK